MKHLTRLGRFLHQVNQATNGAIDLAYLTRISTDPVSLPNPQTTCLEELADILRNEPRPPEPTHDELLVSAISNRFRGEYIPLTCAEAEALTKEFNKRTELLLKAERKLSTLAQRSSSLETDLREANAANDLLRAVSPADQENILRGLRARVAELDRLVADRVNEIGSLQSINDTRNARIHELESQLETERTTVVERNGQIARLTQQVADPRGAIELRDHQITMLRSEILQLQAGKNALQAAVDSHLQEINRIRLAHETLVVLADQKAAWVDVLEGKLKEATVLAGQRLDIIGALEQQLSDLGVNLEPQPREQTPTPTTIPPGFRDFDPDFAMAGGKTFTREGEARRFVGRHQYNPDSPLLFEGPNGAVLSYALNGRWAVSDHHLDLFHPVGEPVFRPWTPAEALGQKVRLKSNHARVSIVSAVDGEFCRVGKHSPHLAGLLATYETIDGRPCGVEVAQ